MALSLQLHYKDCHFYYCYCVFFCRTTPPLYEVRLLTRLRVVDNSQIGRAAELAGKPAKCIQVYNKKFRGFLGDKVL